MRVPCKSIYLQGDGVYISDGTVTEHVEFSTLSDPNSWDADYKTIKFPFNIEKVLRWVLKQVDRVRVYFI